MTLPSSSPDPSEHADTSPAEPQPHSSELLEFLHRIDEEVRVMSAPSVTAIYGFQDNVMKQCGTGTLFRIADKSFLITAKHVAEIASKHCISLFIADFCQNAEMIQLGGKLVLEDNTDVVIWQLEDDIVAKLPNRRFLSVHDCDRQSDRESKGWFLVHGYPTCWSDSNAGPNTTSVTPFAYGTPHYDGATGWIGNYNRDVHLLLDLQQVDNALADGSCAVMPNSLHGISGCSIWHSYYEGITKSAWTVGDAKIVGVETGVYEGKVIKGTRWWVIEELLSKHFPELAATLAIVSPHSRIVVALK